jgi:hypothetical protein
MKHKVSELTGGLLDAAVAKANGWPFDINPIGDGRFCYLTQGAESFCPSTSWATGGPIIEREGIAIAPYEHGIGEPSMWVAWVEERQHQATFDSYFERGIFDDNSRGPTPLIAAMRAYVCSKLGEEVELP